MEADGKAGRAVADGGHPPFRLAGGLEPVDPRGQVGWGYGIHSCVGRTLAQLEADALLGALIKRVDRFEAAGAPEWWMTTIGHGPTRLPIRLHAAAH